MLLQKRLEIGRIIHTKTFQGGLHYLITKAKVNAWGAASYI